MRETFCNDNRYAFWQHGSDFSRCELADLLLDIRTPARSRASPLQTKFLTPRLRRLGDQTEPS